MEQREKWEEPSLEEVELRAMLEGLKVAIVDLEEAEQRVKEVELKGEEENRGLVNLRSVTSKVELTIVEELWPTGRETEE